VPIYEFLCRNCGSFEQWRSFAEVSSPMTCPSCNGEARRIYSMPATKNLSAAFSNAMNRVEKSAHEPEIVRRPKGDALPGTRYHPGHSGHHGHNH
jgi:putative FmdB family regulatory protein